ncbi:type II toxin-antitoxin system VapC family toxin [Planktothricoides raciborskii]|nr:PIN domain-containing protein [Planktothricoides raciborskii]MBD2542559.1 PIN domain-containing protein [Planktothricoides raciborskii FACHB-1370]MBD2581016.1 PIN domain-containing protein [Planktothricoides raciborskii FACHB-1261]
MRRVFADTGYWVALLNPRDELHQTARDLSQKMGAIYIFTSEMVLAEVLNDFSKRGEFFRGAAIELIESLYSHPNVTVVKQSSSQFQDGLLLYKQRPDKEWSITDCVSFKIMEAYGITEAFAYDKQSRQVLLLYCGIESPPIAPYINPVTRNPVSFLGQKPGTQKPGFFFYCHS